MILQLLLGLAAALGIFWTIREKKIFPAIITIGMVIGIAMIFFPFETIKTPGFYVYMRFVALAFLYGIIGKDKKLLPRIIICLMSASIFAYWLWVMNHWHGNTVLFPIFTLLIGVVAFFSKAKLKSELGFLVILAIDAIALIIENWMKAS